MNLLEMKALVKEFRCLGLKRELVREQLEKDIKFNPEEISNYLKLAVYYISINDLKEALVNIKKAVIYDPGDENLWFIKGYIYENKSSYKNALEAYYYAYRLGSSVARDKLMTFLNNPMLQDFNYEQKRIIEEFKESVC